MEKVFILHERSISATAELGIFLRRQEVPEIVRRFGSEAIRSAGSTSLDIVPPLPRDRLPELGAALVQLAKDLDSSEPVPIYRIV